MNTNKKILDELLQSNESEFLDFKQEYPSVNSDLIHDVLCLANSIVDSDRYLVFGVDDSKNICGIESDTKRKTQANLIDVLRSARLNKMPQFTLTKHLVGTHEIDVLIIKDADEKPYFLTEDYTKDGRPLRAGVVYSRIGDTNTPPNSTSADHIIEKMYYDRFGLRLSPKERLFKYLREIEKWHYGYNEERNLYFYHEQFPEFTLTEKNKESSESYVEPWSIDFPDKNSTKSEFFVKYHGTILDNLILVWLDGARYKRIQPTHKIIKSSNNYYHYYYYVNDSLACLANAMIQAAYPDSTGNGHMLDHLFPIFESSEDAERILDADFVKTENDYIWYFFDQTQNDYVKVEKGKHWRIFWKR